MLSNYPAKPCGEKENNMTSNDYISMEMVLDNAPNKHSLYQKCFLHKNIIQKVIEYLLSKIINSLTLAQRPFFL